MYIHTVDDCTIAAPLVMVGLSTGVPVPGGTSRTCLRLNMLTNMFMLPIGHWSIQTEQTSRADQNRRAAEQTSRANQQSRAQQIRQAEHHIAEQTNRAQQSRPAEQPADQQSRPAEHNITEQTNRAEQQRTTDQKSCDAYITI